MAKFQTFVKNHNDFLTYTLFGFLASLINVLSFMGVQHFFHAHYMVANTLAWLISVVFGFFTNKTLVFKSKYSTGYALVTELVAFLFFRGVSLFADSAIMVVCISMMSMSSLWAKIIDQILVGILNYVTTRYIFSRDQQQTIQRLRRWRTQRSHSRKS
ncbi:hypothetical protein FC15_GL001799 [Lapidilactobacillus concavus DSM 17758]|jgi:putative flippase GtrA|uniref:GtrA/DPMS transmembrane domain-containing protein n=1 Tax=Lapidilactobacillus concavus DSM 17758 TaxID=1423735 RepID=A0A0R1VZ45_9LACO|nr:GtrA family protein [Lapidilactobacillus concavus]KRM09147.1 hypothetical protein FC15_GL001799 [Lapidilactobacillus concavus DSM 17758]GEL13779.1 teichoic acid glycosylation protein [Lapidilactobacillus concavus]